MAASAKIKPYRVVLVYPPNANQMKIYVPNILLRDNHSIIPPLSISYLAASLSQRPGIEVRMIDAQRVRKYKQLENSLREKPFDFIGVSAMTLTLFDSLQTLRVARKVNPRAVTCLGGYHMMLYPRETMKHDGIDYGVIGDGEHAIGSLVDGLANGEDVSDIPGLVYRNGNSLKTNDSERIKNLDCLPFPEFPSPLSGEYRSYVDPIRSAPIITSRGCPFHCTYCSSQMCGYRTRSIQNVVEEIAVRKQQKWDSLSFWDETLNSPEKRIQSLCNAMIQSGNTMPFTARVRPDFLSEKTVSLLTKAGCSRLAFGIDITPESTARKYQRNIDLGKTRQALHLSKKAGIITSANFIICLMEENKKDVLDRLAHLRSYKFDFAQFSLLMVFPGTELYTQHLQDNRADFFRQFTLAPKANAAFPLADSPLPIVKRKSLIRKAYRSFYFSPARMVQLSSNTTVRKKGLLSGIAAAFSILAFSIFPGQRLYGFSKQMGN